MTNSIARTLPEAVLIAHSHGMNVVHAYRTHLGYSLDDLAETCGLSVREIEAIESGAPIDRYNMHRIATSLGLAPDTFDGLLSISSAA